MEQGKPIERIKELGNCFDYRTRRVFGGTKVEPFGIVPLMARKKPTYRKFRYWKKPTCKKGANNPSATINATVPRFIRDKYPEWSVAKLSAFTGLSEGYVRGILRNVYWSDGGPKRRLRRKPRLTEEQESAVIQLHYQEGWSDRKIAKAFGVSRGLIQYVLRGKQPYQTKAKKRLIVR